METAKAHLEQVSQSPYREENEEGQRPKPKRKRSGVSPGGTSRRSRPRSSLACLHCRRRKVKCIMDEGRLPCDSCASLQISCVLSRDGDRRKAGSREQVSALQDRLQILESLVTGMQNPLAQARSSAQDVSGDSPVSQAQRDTDTPINTNGNNAIPEDEELRAVDSERPGIVTHDTSDLDCASWGFKSTATRSSQHQSGIDVFEALVSTPGSAHADDGCLTPPASEKEADRLDMDQDRRQLRFYGPTGNQHIRSREVQIDGELPLSAEQIDIDSPTVRQLLLEIFWKVQPLSVILIERSVFEKGRITASRCDDYSDFLENSLLACATRMHTSSDVRGLGGEFAERATALVASELQDPNIASLIGFLLLSDFESTRGRNRLGYMYCGISSRLIFDLGLAENCATLIAQGLIAQSESIRRHLLFLATFVYDKLWSFYLGRPSAIPNSLLASAEHRMSEHGWQPEPRIQAWVGLCRDMSEVTVILNSAAPLDCEGIQKLVTLDNRIEARSKDLDSSLVLQDHRFSELPANAYGLHVQLLGIRIVLHKFLSKAVLSAGSPHTDSTSTPRLQESISVEHCRGVMHENAVRIARLVSVYQQIFGIENIIVIMLDNMFVAAGVLISHVLQRTATLADSDSHWLRVVAEILQKAQKHYPVIARMRSTLSGFVEKTSLSGIFGNWTVSKVNTEPQSQQQSLFQPPVELFGIDGTFAQHFGSRDHATTSLDSPLPFREYGEHVTQDMDLNNMMSWALSPPV